MKRYGNLWSQITSIENLILAARKAQKGKRYRDNVLQFNYHLDREIQKLQAELIAKTYAPQGYRTFQIVDPKHRIISAAPFRDRVVHHALCNIIVPLLEPSLIDDTYANRKGYGTHKALRRFASFCRSSRYVLQCDIQKYFPSIDIDILKGKVRTKLKYTDTLWLIDTILETTNNPSSSINHFSGDSLLTPLERKSGLPIGNLTNQFFANFYLNSFDRFVKEKLKVKKYIRFVDDFAMFSDDRIFLADVRQIIEEKLDTLRLKIHPVKSQLFETQLGANFLGFRVFPDRIRVRSDNLRRAKQRFKHQQFAFAIGELSTKELVNSIQNYEAHLKHGDTWRLRQQIFADLAFARQ